MKCKNIQEAESYLNSISLEEIECRLLWNEIHRFNRLKEKLELQYKFEIPNYIVDEIINGNNYNNLCYLITLAVNNNRISKVNANILKEGELKSRKCDTISI